MRKIGIIKNYDGYIGDVVEIDYSIEKNKKKYLLMKKDILYNNAKNGDIVKFDAEMFSSICDDVLVARFVKKIK